MSNHETTPLVPSTTDDLIASLDGIAGSRKVFEVLITTERGCDISEGEYSVDIVRILHGSLDENDSSLVRECIDNEVSDLSLPEEGQTPFIVYESGEREDVFWNKYYRLAPSDTKAPDIYACIGKGGMYEFLGIATGAGTSKGQPSPYVYRDIETGHLYFREATDFYTRMEPLS